MGGCRDNLCALEVPQGPGGFRDVGDEGTKPGEASDDVLGPFPLWTNKETPPQIGTPGGVPEKLCVQ